MAQSFWVALINILVNILVGILAAVVLWLVPSLDVPASALELPEDLQNFLDQAASDLNFPYPFSSDEDLEQDRTERTESSNRVPHKPPTALKAPGIEAPTLSLEAQKAASSQQHLD
jgi:hypothetical protein